MSKYYVNFKINAYYTAEVEADNIEDAKAKAEAMFGEADFGEASDIDGNAIYAENENGETVWENR